MDGVVADFNEYAYRVHGFGSEVEYPDELWNQIAKNPRLYRDLKKTPYADDLVQYCKNFVNKHNLEIYFLTAVPKSNRLHWSFTDKVNWARIIEAAETNPTLQDAVDRVIMIYELSKENE